MSSAAVLDPSSGLVAALIIGALAGVSAFFVGRSELTSYQALGAVAAGFAASYALLNVALQPHLLSLDLLRSEVASGRLALRVTSITILVSYASLLYALKVSESLPHPFRVDLYTDIKAWSERDRGWPLGTLASQASLLMVALAASWSFAIFDRHSIVVALLNWSFAFVSDDFFLAASYRRKLGVSPPAFEKRRINSLRRLVYALLVIAAFTEYSAWVGVAAVTVCSFFTIVVPLRRWYIQGGQQAIASIGVMPDYQAQLEEQLEGAVKARSEAEEMYDEALRTAATYMPAWEIALAAGKTQEEIQEKYFPAPDPPQAPGS